MKVTLISTVKDCADGVDAFLASLAAQTRAPDEVVIVDGGSTDGTAERFAAEDTVTLIVEPGANIARGRNVALAAATHDVIAVTDADCTLEPDVARRDRRPDRGGRRRLDGLLRGADRRLPPGLHGLGEPPAGGERGGPGHVQPVGEVGGLPSRRDRGRSAATRNGWRSARTCGSTCDGANEASTCGSRPKPWCGGGPGHRSPRRGSSTSGTRAATRRRGCIRTATPCGSRPTADSQLRSPPSARGRRLLAVAGGVAYARSPVRRAWRRFEGTRERAIATIAVPALIAFTDTAKMAGYAAGLADRARR